MNEVVTMLKDAPVLLQLVAAYILIKGGHIGIDRYKQRNGNSPNTKRAVEQLEEKLVPFMQRLEEHFDETRAAWKQNAESHSAMAEAQNNTARAIQSIKEFMVVVEDRTRNPRGT